MFRSRLLLPAMLLLVLGLTGCGSARLLQANSEGGIVAIPNNSNCWPYYHRDEAMKLMAQKCPNGYDIVEEKEVVIGQTKTVSESVQRDAQKGKAGESERKNKVTAVANVSEYRIAFKAKTPATPAGLPPVVSTRTPSVNDPEIMQAGFNRPADGNR